MSNKAKKDAIKFVARVAMERGELNYSDAVAREINKTMNRNMRLDSVRVAKRAERSCRSLKRRASEATDA